jgi:hypothetical protein
MRQTASAAVVWQIRVHDEKLADGSLWHIGTLRCDAPIGSLLEA